MTSSTDMSSEQCRYSFTGTGKVSKGTEYSSLQLASPLYKNSRAMIGSHSVVACSPADVTFLLLPQPKPVLNLATPGGCRAELNMV